MASLNGTRSDAGGGLPGGYEPPMQDRGGGGGGGGTTAAVSQLFARLTQEIEEQKPKNCIHFMVDFLCKHYPEHLHGFASIWQMDPDLERERHEVVNFFKAHKISTAVAAHFTNAGFDTLDTLTTLSPDSLVDVEAFNNVKWLPGHKVRLQQIFGEISARVRAYRQQYLEHPQRKHQQHQQHKHHHRHHVHDRHDSPPAYHRSDHASSSGHSYAPAAIANHASAVSHHAPVVHHVSHPDAMVHHVSHAPAVREVVHHMATSIPPAAHQVSSLAPPGSLSSYGGHAPHLTMPVSAAPMGGGISSLSPGINPSNNIFLQNLPPPQF